MERYIITTFVLFISSTVAAPGIEITSESNNVPAVPRGKTGRQFVNDDLSSFLFTSPLETSEFAAREDELSMEDNAHAADTIDTDVIVDKATVANGEMMHTAENLVFRPLFSYRKLQEKRRRLYGTNKPSNNNSPNTIRRSSYYVAPQRFAYYPYAYNSRPYYTSGGYYYPY